MSAKRRVALAAALMTVAAVLAAPAAAGAAGHSDYNRELAELRASIAQFHNPDRAAEAGYGLATGCIENAAGDGMGVHLINWSLYDTTVEVDQPEALVYEPMKNGRLRLVAVEYLVPQALWDAQPGTDDEPTVFGLDMHAVPGLPFYALHAWVFKHNPSGMHADFNPTVTCEYWD